MHYSRVIAPHLQGRWEKYEIWYHHYLLAISEFLETVFPTVNYIISIFCSNFFHFTCSFATEEIILWNRIVVDWGHDQFPGELAPVLDLAVSKGVFPNIQAELPWWSFKPFPHVLLLWEEINTALSTPLHQEIVDSEELTPHTPLLYSEQM